MPYTLAHPAAILPFRRLGFLTYAGLFIGALTPDFEHVFRLRVLSIYSHTPFGLFWFCIPVGLAVVLLYRHVWVYPLARYFPQFQTNRKSPPIWSDALSVWLGSVSHVVWDAFTHEERFGTELFPILNEDIHIANGIIIPGWNFMQHLSTGVGLAIVALAIAGRAHRLSPGWIFREGFKPVVAMGILSIVSVLITAIFWSEKSTQMILILASNNLLALIAIYLTFEGLRIRNRARQG